MAKAPIDKLLKPRSIALVGASERDHSAGLRILQNIVRGNFDGPVYPVNPRYREVLGLRCHSSLSDLPEVPDAVFVAVSADKALATMEEAGRLGVGAMLTNATGFGDAGEEGFARERRMVALADQYGIAVCGPNNSGFMNLWDNVYCSTFYQLPYPNPGPVAFISQSGQVSCAVGQDDRDLGLGYNITTGTEAVLGVADYAEFVLRDERINTLMFFLETVREPQRFEALAREAARLGKHIVVTKVGRSEAGRSAAAAHSGALVGDDKIYDAFFARNGIVRASDLDEMIETALLFSRQKPPARPGVVCMTISGGENGLISDIAADVGLGFLDLPLATVEALKPYLSPYLSPRNPLDIMGLGWSRERFAEILRVLLADDAVGTLAIGFDASGRGVAGVRIATDMAEAVLAADRGDTRVVFFTGTAGGGPNRDVDALLQPAGIPILSGMRAALAALAHWTAYRGPEAALPEPATRSSAAFDALICADEAARFAVLRDVGVPMISCAAVTSADGAAAAAAAMGYPVVLKGTAPDLPHKSELNLVRLNLATAEAVRAAFLDVDAALKRYSRSAGAAVVVQKMAGDGVELIIAARREPEFGTVVVAGLGGVLVELIKDAATRIGPVMKDEAVAMLCSTRAATLLGGVRGKGPYDIDAAAEAIAALSRFAHDAGPDLLSVEINPLIVQEKGKGAVGVDIVIETASPPGAKK
jgi:acyl-CoA synthetase (NDP forming)